jgi:uncharacterized protein
MAKNFIEEAVYNTPVEMFSPFQSLFAQLSDVLREPGDEPNSDGSHDISHLERVWASARQIAAEEGGNLKLLAAAVILHDCVKVEKNSPLRAQASRLAAEKASQALRQLQWSEPEIAIVAEAISSHSYSAGLIPKTLEGRILQDADRLDAIGMVGIARCFYTAGRIGSSLYHPADPRGHARAQDDARYALDHFPLKLLRLAAGFQTPTGARMAAERHTQLQAFYDQFLKEVERNP